MPAAARTALKLLQRLQHGTLTVQLPDGSTSASAMGDLPHAPSRLQELERVQRGAEVRRHRLCRKLHRRRLDHAQPDRPAQGVHPTARRWKT
jgi:hypothetical protein